MATLEELYTKNPPKTSKINKNGDKTPIEPDGGKDLATNETAIKKARNGDLGNGAGGYTPVKPYSQSIK